MLQRLPLIMPATRMPPAPFRPELLCMPTPMFFGQNAPAAGGGGAFSSPADAANLWEWWEPSREVGLSDNDLMATLNGQTNNRDWTQATEANKPTYKTNQINSLAAVQFTGSPREFTGPDMSALTAGHILAVLKTDNDPAASSATSGLWMLGTEGANNDHYNFTNASCFLGAGSDTRKDCGNPIVALTSWHVLEIVTKSGEFTARWNGGTVGSGNHFTTASNTVAFTSTPRLGRSITTPYMTGYFAGLYIFSAELSAGDRTGVIGYINNRFALSSS